MLKNSPCANKIKDKCILLIPRDLKLKTRRNEPKHLPHIAQVIAKLRNTTLNKFIQTVTENSVHFFNL